MGKDKVLDVKHEHVAFTCKPSLLYKFASSQPYVYISVSNGHGDEGYVELTIDEAEQAIKLIQQAIRKVKKSFNNEGKK